MFSVVEKTILCAYWKSSFAFIYLDSPFNESNDTQKKKDNKNRT